MEHWTGLHEHEGKMIYACPEPECWYRALAQDDNHHGCPYGSKVKNGINMSRSLIQMMWEELDKVVGQIMVTNHDDPWLPQLKGQATGIATCITIVHTPHFKTSEDVSKEALRRFRIREAANPEELHYTINLDKPIYLTPENERKFNEGRLILPSRPYTPPPGTPVQQRIKTETSQVPKHKVAAQAQAAAAAKPSTLKDEEKTAIRSAAATGMFKHEQLASMYRVSIAEIRTIVSG